MWNIQKQKAKEGKGDKRMIKECPNCHAFVPFSPHAGDQIHDCGAEKQVSSLALKQEDVRKIAMSATNPDGTTQTANNVMMAGIGNKFEGTLAGIRGAKGLLLFTPRGNNASTTRQRSHLEYLRDDFDG